MQKNQEHLNNREEDIIKQHNNEERKMRTKKNRGNSNYQCEKRSHVTSLNLNPRFVGYCGRIELMPVADLLVVVSDRHFYAWSERVKNISYDSTNNERLRYSCH